MHGGKGALIKPWLPTEIKEQRHWDISASERLEILKKFSSHGLTHWGCRHPWGGDHKKVSSGMALLPAPLHPCRAPRGSAPEAQLEAPGVRGSAADLETPMASDQAADWIRISEMLLGPTPPGFGFVPKHKSNAYDKAENG